MRYVLGWGAHIVRLSAACYCSSLSQFNGTLSDTTALWRRGERAIAVLNLFINLMGLTVLLSLLIQHHMFMRFDDREL